MIERVRATLRTRPGLVQLIRFCIVGASSTLLDFGLFNLVHYRLGVPIAPALTLSFLVSVCNGFYWNRRWTFAQSAGDARRQGPRFLATNTVGWLLNLSITTGALLLATRLGWVQTQRSPQEIVALIAAGQGKHEFAFLALNGAKACATVVVTAWNFTAAKFITFRD
jgi:putative flippase GtrA